jgi:hypothetical protein
MGHIILSATSTTVERGRPFTVCVSVQGAAPGRGSVRLAQYQPSGPELATVELAVLGDGAGSNDADVTLEATGLVTVRGVDAAGQLGSDTLTLMVNEARP